MVVQGQLSAALPVAAYALTAYHPRWSVRIPALVVASGVVLAVISGDWPLHSAVVVTCCFVLWPATLGAYVPARAQLILATTERAERAERAEQHRPVALSSRNEYGSPGRCTTWWATGSA